MFHLKSILEKPSSKIDQNDYYIFPTTENNQSLATFPLQQLLSFKNLMSNGKFARLVRNIEQYNHNLQQHGEENIIQYKVYEFLYDSLNICTTKTDSEIDNYLEIIECWSNKYNTKRGFKIIQRKAKKLGNQDEVIRETFKSNLPTEINEYKRKVIARELLKENDEMDSFDKGLKEDEEVCFPKFKTYQIELRNMCKEREKGEEEIMKKQIKKHHSRMQSITGNNFFKTLENKNDTIRLKATTQKQSFFTSFYPIKKHRIEQILNKKTDYINIDQKNGQQKQISNIDGLFLLRNPFEVPKKTKTKKRK